VLSGAGRIVVSWVAFAQEPVRGLVRRVRRSYL